MFIYSIFTKNPSYLIYLSFQDFSKDWTEDNSSYFTDECLPVLFSIFRKVSKLLREYWIFKILIHANLLIISYFGLLKQIPLAIYTNISNEDGKSWAISSLVIGQLSQILCSYWLKPKYFSFLLVSGVRLGDNFHFIWNMGFITFSSLVE